MRKSWIGLLCGLSAAAIWGGMYVVSDVVLEVIPPFTLLTIRLGLGALAAWTMASWQGGLNLSRKQFFQVAGAGVIGYGVSLGLQFVGTRLSTAANGALLTSTAPAFVLLFAAWILKEPITPRRVGALILSTLGVVAVLDIRAVRLAPDLFWGNVALVGAGLTWALYSVLLRKIAQEIPVWTIAVVAILGGLPATIPAMGWELQTMGIGIVTPGVSAGAFYLGVVSTAVATALWARAFVELEASVASLTFFAQPVVGVALSAWLLGERLSGWFFIGGVLIGVGVWLAGTVKGT
ncbi:MAG: DMT family transporter [Anaerolineales bacterium]|nr:DMT family transporter [Anaerolineales bacterium]